ncbi:MAG TPA: tetratricopeptide repeat protein [Pyrinomonadaceae bacterium]|nr:tetratricopeptide repeat protein [Pyrinomonadaceae bacterium]
MRILSFIFVIFLAISASAQSIVIKQNFDEATKLANAKDFEKALTIYQKLSGIAQNEAKEFRAKIHFNIGVCLYQLKNQSEAIAEYERAVLLNPRYEKAFYALGMAHFELNDFEKAEKAFINSLQINAKNGETWFDLAFLYLSEENFDAAETAFQNAVKFGSVAAADAHNNLGVISALRHDFETAENHFKLAAGKSSEARNNLQFCKFYKENNYQELIAKLEFSK